MLIFVPVGKKKINLDRIFCVYKGAVTSKVICLWRGEPRIFTLDKEHKKTFDRFWVDLHGVDYRQRYFVAGLGLYIRLPFVDGVEVFEKEIDGRVVSHVKVVSRCRSIILRDADAVDFVKFLNRRKII